MLCKTKMVKFVKTRKRKVGKNESKKKNGGK